MDTAQTYGPVLPGPQFTGNFLMQLRADVEPQTAIEILGDIPGVTSVLTTEDPSQHAVDADEMEEAGATYFSRLGVAVVRGVGPEIISQLSADERVENTEAEQVMVAFPDDSSPIMVDRGASATAVIAMPAPMAGPTFNESAFTWGLQATGADISPFSGEGIRVAVLDTGMMTDHPDFQGRSIDSRSFVTGETAEDGHGHGTHCIGTACGPRNPFKAPGKPPSYGCAPNCDIFAGKVLSNRGSGTDANILAGIEWAVASGCQVISMSLGAPVLPGQGFSPIYEAVARRAFENGTLICAAAGNNSQRHLGQPIKPVNRPANCPSIMAVTALTSHYEVPWFSAGTVNQPGGGVDIAAPGVDVHSSYIQPALYHTMSGTSMATPHVAGIAALYAQAFEASGRSLGQILYEGAGRLNLLSADVGMGLVQAPQAS